MAITTDAFGNTFAGNFASGDTWEPNDLLTVLRTALGSNDRANINKSTNSNFRIDWRPNIAEETRTGVIASPSASIIGVSSQTLATNSRMGFCQHSTSDGNLKNPFLLESNFLDTVNFNVLSPTFPVGTQYWAVATTSSISYFVSSSSTNYCFLTTGVLKNTNFTYPNNRYGLYTHLPIVNGETIGHNYNAGLVPIRTFNDIANYPHTRLSDNTATNSEVELYLRRESDNFPLGYAPNVFKWKVNGVETAPIIGDTVRLNMANAVGDYVGQGNIFCKVVGRLGNTSETDRTGDYLLMRVAG